MSTYAEFLSSKARRAERLGREVAPADVHPMLHDWQADIVPVSRAVRAGGGVMTAAVCRKWVGPVWKLGGETCVCKLRADHFDGQFGADHECDCGAWFADCVARDPDGVAS